MCLPDTATVASSLVLALALALVVALLLALRVKSTVPSPALSLVILPSLALAHHVWATFPFSFWRGTLACHVTHSTTAMAHGAWCNRIYVLAHVLLGVVVVVLRVLGVQVPDVHGHDSSAISVQVSVPDHEFAHFFMSHVFLYVQVQRCGSRPSASRTLLHLVGQCTPSP